MAIKTHVFPAFKKSSGKSLTKVNNFQSEMITALTKYLQEEQGIADVQGIVLPGMKKALKLVKSAQGKIAGSKNDLAVKAGIDGSGHLVMSINGILPGPKKYEEEVVLRPKFTGLMAELSSEKNAVVNLTKSEEKADEIVAALMRKHGGDVEKVKKDRHFKTAVSAHFGDDVINRAVEKQARKFKAAGVSADDADFGEITTGTVILAAHGSKVEASGRILGTRLGKKTPQEIVAFLTENSDPKKNLNPKFKGTVLLSGCYTAAGGIAPPDSDYDYDTFAGKVWNLLKAKGFKSVKVQGLPGTARTLASGDKSSVKPTEQKAYDQLKKQHKELGDRVTKLAGVLKKLKEKHGDDQTAFQEDRGIALVQEEIGKLRTEADRVHAEKESKVMEKLIATYGLGQGR